MTTIHPTASIEAGAQLAEGVEVGPYCVVGPNVQLGEGTRLISHVVVDGWTRIGAGCTLFPFSCVGMITQDLKYRGAKTSVEIGDRTTLREYVTVNSGTNEGEVTRVGSRCHIMAYCHIAHACQIGNEVIMSNASNLGGEVTVEDQAIIGGVTGIHQFVRIGRLCMVGGLSRITQDCPPFMLVVGSPAEVKGLNAVGLQRHGVSADAQKHLKHAYQLLCRESLSTRQALERIQKEIPACDEVAALISFIQKSERGIVK